MKAPANMALVSLAVAALGALAGCNPYLAQQSVAPPGRTARLQQVDGFWGLKRYRLEVSHGVALALTCYKGGPCERLQVVSDNPAIAEVRPAAVAQLEAIGNGSAFVVVGKAPGTTHVRVKSSEGTRDVTVTVVAAPAAPSMTIAAEPISYRPTRQ